MNPNIHFMKMEEDTSSSSSVASESYDEGDQLPMSDNDITAQLVAAGTVGMAAAAAIASAKKRKRLHSFETNPSIRKRQQTRLLRKLKATVDEYAARVGQQAVVLIVTPGKQTNNFKVFGANPLETVVRNCKDMIVHELEHNLTENNPATNMQDDPSLHDLPPLVIDGIPTPVEKMTQVQLRTFIPLMLRYSTGKAKPGWGRESTRPTWWPEDLPWANVRSDVRAEEDKKKVSWTHALRQIVLNCYKFHNREDLLPSFTDEDSKSKVNNLISIPTSQIASSISYAQPSVPLAAQYAPTLVQTISNPDGTISLIQMEPGTTLVTLPDGTKAQLRAVSWPDNAKIHGLDGPQALAGITANNITTQHSIAVDGSEQNGSQTLATLTEATINQEGQIILTGEDGIQSAFPVAGMVIPVSMYQTVVAHLNDTQSMQVEQMNDVKCVAVSVQSTTENNAM